MTQHSPSIPEEEDAAKVVLVHLLSLSLVNILVAETATDHTNLEVSTKEIEVEVEAVMATEEAEEVVEAVVSSKKSQCFREANVPSRSMLGLLRLFLFYFSHGPGDTLQHAPAVKTIENKIDQNLKSAKPQAGPATALMPPRPGFGTRGREVLLWTNYFELVSYGDLILHRYNLDISPDQAGRRPAGKKARRVVELLLEDHFARHKPGIATDFKSILISSAKLDIGQGKYDIVYRTEEEDEPLPNAKHFQIRLMHTGSMTVSELMNDLTSTNAGALLGSKEEIIQALNIIVGHHPKAASNVASIGANRHYALNAAASEKMSLGAGLAAIRGFFVSVRAATGRLLVNIQVKNGAFYEDGPLERLMIEHLDSTRGNKMKLAKFLRLLSVNVTHIVRKNRAGIQVPRIKVIHGLAMRNDGARLPHPPVIPQPGAGPKEVSFYLENAAGESSSAPAASSGGKKGKKAPKPGPKPPSQGRYITVYDFFKSGMKGLLIAGYETNPTQSITS